MLLRDWLIPIPRGRLVVELQGEVIDAAAARMLAPGVLGEVAAPFASAVAEDDGSGTVLPGVSAHVKVGLDEGLLPAATLAGTPATYQEGGIVRARLPVSLFPRSGGQADSHVDLFLQRNRVAPGEAGLRGYHLWQWGDITVPDGCPLKGDDVLAALVAREEPVAEFLAAAEPPAHDKWTVTERLRHGWLYARDTLPLIRNAPARLRAMLSTGQQEQAPDELIDFFHLNEESGEAGKGGREPGSRRDKGEAVARGEGPSSRRSSGVSSSRGSAAASP